MPALPCPVCGALTTRLLDAPSEYAAVNYYRCDPCGHVWTTAKNDPTKIQHVTDLPANAEPISRSQSPPKKQSRLNVRGGTLQVDTRALNQFLDLRRRFDRVHAQGLEALRSRDYERFGKAIQEERELIQQQSHLLESHMLARGTHPRRKLKKAEQA